MAYPHPSKERNEKTHYVSKEKAEKISVIIRRATIDDVDSIVRLMNEWKPFIDSESVKQIFLESMRYPDEHFIFIAEGNNIVVGFAYWILVPYFVWGCRSGELQSLFVSRKYRRQGIATLLMKTGMDILKSFVTQYRIVDISRGNTTAWRFYHKLGFNYEIRYLKQYV